MSNFQAALRTMIRHSTNLKEVITELNHQTERSARGENFITFFIAMVDVIKKELYYVNAGHNPPFVIIDSQAPEYLELGTTILGSFEPLPFLKVGRVTYQRELVFFSFTDGLTETFDEQQEPFGVERVTKVVEKHQRATLEQINNELLSELNNFRGKNAYNDDITLLSCKVLAEN
jgi:sigma-B regulation protein RsbU (phosphoserine phosphatase)